MKFVETVLGPVPTDKLGFTLMHEHVMAMALKLQGKPNMVYSIIGDGEAQEGQVWETMLIAPNKGVKNFIVLLDNNRQQLDDFTDKISSLGDVRKKAEDFGWYALDVDGHDVAAIDDAIEACKASDKPGFINMHTIKGKGWPAKEAVNGNHACLLRTRALCDGPALRNVPHRRGIYAPECENHWAQRRLQLF